MTVADDERAITTVLARYGSRLDRKQVDEGLGRFEPDELVRHGDTWRFRSRRCTCLAADGPSERP